MKFILFAFTLITTFVFVLGSAKADYFVWQDAHVRVSLTFPDTWQQVNNADPDDALTIMAPSGRALSQCRLRVRDDKRHVIYPPRYNWAVQKIDYSMGFWDQYLREYSDSRVHILHDGAGLGRGFSSYVETSYSGAVPGPMMDRKSLAFVSMYYDKIYVLECSSHRDAFDQWKQIFLSIAKTVDFDKKYHEATTGNYRHFMGDPPLILRGTEGEETTYY
jgi:hypothetical protein